MRKQITLGGTTFVSLSLAREAAREILESATLNTTLVGHAFEFASDLLRHHPRYEDKIGCGLASIYVRLVIAPGGKEQRCFFAKRLNGSAVDFSFLKCLAAPTHRQRVLAAMRNAVAEQIKWFARESLQFEVPCAISGKPITKGNFDVHHARAFIDLANEFTKAEYDSIAIDYEAEQLGDRLHSREFIDRWQSWHGDNAQLCVVIREHHKELHK